MKQAFFDRLGKRKSAYTPEDREIVKLILCAGIVKANEANGYESPLYLAAKNGHEDAVDELLGEANTEFRDQSGNTPLMKAAEMNDDDSIVKKLLERGALIDTHNDQRMTALNWAVRNFHPRIAHYLITQRANFTHCYNSGNSTSVTVWDDADPRYANETYKDDRGIVVPGRIDSMLSVLPPRQTSCQ